MTEPIGELDVRDIDDDGAPLAIRVAAEAAGTFILVFVGIGALLYSGALRQEDPFITALAFGVALSAAIALFANVSGAHVNPAVSLGAALKGSLRWIDLPAYWLGQILGGTAAAGILFITLPDGLAGQVGSSDRALFGQTANTFGDSSFLSQISEQQLQFSVGQVIALEVVATGILVAVCLGTRSWVRNAVVPVVAGLTYTGLLIVLGPVSGGSLNPARSTASAIIAGGDALGQLWLFWVAPLVGGALAGISYALFAPRPVLDEDWDEDDDEDWDEEDWDEEDDLDDDSDDFEDDADSTDDAEVSEADLEADLDGERSSAASTVAFDPDDAEPVARLDDQDVEIVDIEDAADTPRDDVARTDEDDDRRT